MSFRTLKKGLAHSILAFEKVDGSIPALEFLRGLEERERKKMVALIDRAADHGPPNNRERNKPEEGTRFFEFKTHGYRLFWRWSFSGDVILMNGFAKRGDRIPRSDLHAGLALFDSIEAELQGRDPDERN